MVKIGKQLSKYIENQKVKQSDIAKKLNVSPSYISSVKRNLKGLDDKSLDVWANLLGVNRNWLLTGEGSMLKETAQADNNAIFVAPYIKDELIYLPLFSVPALASFMDNTSQATGTIETYPVYVAKGEAYTKDKHIVIEVKGESMYPTINNKAMILCEKVEPEQWDNVQSEQIIAIVYDNSFTIKRVLRNNLATTNTLTLSADNPKYGTLEVARCDIKGIYKAIKKVSEYFV